SVRASVQPPTTASSVWFSQLRPIRAAVAHISAVRALRDNSFQSALFGQLEQLFSVLQLMVGITKPLRCMQQPLQQLLAFQQRRAPQVISVAIEKVERK